MRVLLVHCHPRADSFSASLRATAVATLEDAGHEVEIIDLYAQNFDPRLSGDERGGYYDEAAIPLDIAGHVAALRRAEMLVLVYPTWWFGMPAMLKGGSTGCGAPASPSRSAAPACCSRGSPASAGSRW